ncbi:MAG: hypothetical protein ACO3UW_10855 [Candidatus Nanopelagicales bacterium]
MTGFYGITTDRGEYRTRAQVRAEVTRGLRRMLVSGPMAGEIADRYLDDAVWMARHANETAGSIAREVRADEFGAWAR